MFAAGAKKVFPSMIDHSGWTQTPSFATLQSEIKRNKTNLMTIHLFSSCPMGENKNICAVDSFGKVHDFENLWIADASIIPEAMGTNPQGIIMALVLRNMDHFIEQQGSK